MINEHSCFICIGSNFRAEKSLNNARLVLEASLGKITWAEPTNSDAIGHPDWPPFINQCGVFKTIIPLRLIKMQLKGIEDMCGRNPEEKRDGCIEIDIDLIAFDGEVIKDTDVDRDYIKKGAKQLGIAL